jgi:hypothetical protein
MEQLGMLCIGICISFVVFNITKFIGVLIEKWCFK